jgi:hypothetical protein
LGLDPQGQKLSICERVIGGGVEKAEFLGGKLVADRGPNWFDGLDAQDQLGGSVSYLKLKRSIRKVEKLKPGLSQALFRNILSCYEKLTPA